MAYFVPTDGHFGPIVLRYELQICFAFRERSHRTSAAEGEGVSKC